MATLRNFFLSVSFIVSLQVRIFPLNMRDIIIYVSRWWEKYLWKSSLIKHTCSWRDRLIILWTLDRQAKIFLRIPKMTLTILKWIFSLQESDSFKKNVPRSFLWRGGHLDLTIYVFDKNRWNTILPWRLSITITEHKTCSHFFIKSQNYHLVLPWWCHQ